MSLIIKNLSVDLSGRRILSDINLEVKSGKIHAVMGPNGSGKSTLAQALMGNPNYKLQNSNSKLQIGKKDIKNLKPDERGRMGLFLAFQNPIAIPGVTVANLLKTAYKLKKETKNPKERLPQSGGLQPRTPEGRVFGASKLHNPALSVWEFNEILVRKAKALGIPQEFLRKSLNEAFSGGEKKKLEMLQAAVLSPKYAIFDEIDTGLDVDALKIVAAGINKLKNEGSGIFIITHYLRILKYVRPDYVHILVNGKIVKSGGYKLAAEVEKKGYKKWHK